MHGFHEGRSRTSTRRSGWTHVAADGVECRGAWLPEGAYGAGPIARRDHALVRQDPQRRARAAAAADDHRRHHQPGPPAARPGPPADGGLPRRRRRGGPAAGGADRLGGDDLRPLGLRRGDVRPGGRARHRPPLRAARLHRPRPRRAGRPGARPGRSSASGSSASTGAAAARSAPRSSTSRTSPAPGTSRRRARTRSCAERSTSTPTSRSTASCSGEPDGRDDAGKRKAKVMLHLADDPPPRLALWQFLGGLDLVGRVTYGDFPPADPLPWALRDLNALKLATATSSCGCGSSTSPRALAARPWTDDGDVVLDVADAQGHVAGRYRVITRGGTAEVVRHRRRGRPRPRRRGARLALARRRRRRRRCTRPAGSGASGGRRRGSPRWPTWPTSRTTSWASERFPGPAYDQDMGWLILLVVVVGGYLAWKNRVALIAKITGQDQARIQRQIGRRGRDYAAPRYSVSSRDRRASNAAEVRSARACTLRANASRELPQHEERTEAGEHERHHDRPQHRHLVGDQQPDPEDECEGREEQQSAQRGVDPELLHPTSLDRRPRGHHHRPILRA